MRTLFAAVAAVCLLAVPALAQDAVTVVPAVDTTISAGPLYAIFVSYLVPILGTILMAGVGWLIGLLNTKWGLNIEAGHRDSLQTALTNAAGLVLARIGTYADKMVIDTHSAAIAAAVRYVEDAAPDALKRFGLGPDDIAQKILAKIPQVAQPGPVPTVEAGHGVD